MRSLPALALAVSASLSLAGPSVAQSRDQLVQAFSGNWFVFDPSFAAGGNCGLTLGGAVVSNDGQMSAATENCAEAIARTKSWSIEGGVLRLFDDGGSQLAELGGNQRRVTGLTTPEQSGVIIERASGDGFAQEIALAVQEHRCYYYGTSANCATKEDLVAPSFAEEEGEMLAQIETLGNLAVRSQPRRDATMIGTVPANSCVRVNQCVTASDGLWCRAAFGERQGWLAKTALRKETWPIVTFANGCSDTADKG
ncbi:SH3 domain-containing protein [Pseudooceanicola nanhaiensis]|uniref:SH3 domain-containing protein n=1 Tax=Pseudooceanicola nanhaiensis TaxID=375761 RepID=UPI001CD3AF25|nr:hypothetical protein [Pseudooceanicola nanhaiensis]MCA0922090.1 hypothetical protein [Pseudooceanicola nanhaiensis]